MYFSVPGIHDAFARVIWWIISNYIEVFATLTGLIYLVYSVKGNILCWLFGIISSLCFVYVFFHSKIYGNMGLYAYYVFVSIYGWIYWSKSYSDEKEFRVSIINMKYGGILLAISSILFVLIAVGLKKYTDSDIVFLDAFTTSLSIVATWMLARKILYHWLVWIVIDSVYIAMYIYKGLYATLILFVVYTIFAVIGYIEWHKKWKIQVTK